MESRSQNPEFRINPNNFHPCNSENFHPCKLGYEPKHSKKLKMWIIEYVKLFLVHRVSNIAGSN